MARNLLDMTGKPLEVDETVISAFAAFQRGEANRVQQQIVLQTILNLSGVARINPLGMSEGDRSFTDGAEWLAKTIVALTGQSLVLRTVDEPKRP